ncbi:MAG: hypothetical protein QM687_14370 [Ferruginibacter sp.]
MRLITLLTVFFLNFYSSDASGQQKGLKLVCSIKKTVVYKHDDLRIRLMLFNETTENVLIHQHLDFGYQSMCMDDFCFEVEKYTDGKFSAIPENASIQQIPLFDSLGNAYDEMYDSLQAGQKLLQEFNINGYYWFGKGKYRVRFSFQQFDQSNKITGQIFSEWLYFYVKPKYVAFKLKGLQ